MSSAGERLLHELVLRGVRVEVRDGELTLSAPRGVLTSELREAARALKSELTRLVEHSARTIGQSAGDANRDAKSRPSLSLLFFASEPEFAADKYRLVRDAARFADVHGFEAVWIPERHFHPMGGLFPNPSVVAAAVASATERLSIRAGSVVLPLHDPLRVAEEWAVVDNLSGGRVAISFAPGWHAADFVFAPDKYTTRHEHLRTTIDVVRRLWRGEPIRRTGGAGQPIEVVVHPRPVQPELPVWLTAIGNPESFHAAGTLGTNLLTCLLGQSVEEVTGKIAMYRGARKSAGFESAGRVTLMVHAYVGDDLDATRELLRKPFCRYLRTTLDLLSSLARTLDVPLDPKKLTDADVQTLVTFAYEQYFGERSLLGTRTTSRAFMDRMAAIGVDEIACLVDFGLPGDAVMASLERLSEVRS